MSTCCCPCMHAQQAWHFQKTMGSLSAHCTAQSHKSADPHHSRDRNSGGGCFYQINLFRLLQTSHFLRDFQILRTLCILLKKREPEARPQNTQTVFVKLQAWQLWLKSSLPFEQNGRNKEWVQEMKEKKRAGRKETKSSLSPSTPLQKNKNKICSVLETPTRHLDFKQLNTYTGS